MQTIISFFHYWSPIRSGLTLRHKDTNNNNKEIIFSESIPSAEISTFGHIVIAFCYTVVVSLFSFGTIYQFLNRPETTSVSVVPAEKLSLMEVDIEVSCSNAPRCGDIIITTNYTGTNTECEKRSPVSVITIPANKTGKSTRVTIQVCFFGSPVFSTNTKSSLKMPGVVVEYSSVNPGKVWKWWKDKMTGKWSWVWRTNATWLGQGIVKVFRKGETDDNDVIRVVNLDAWQIKALVLSQIVHTSSGAAAPAAIDNIPEPVDVAVNMQDVVQIGKQIVSSYIKNMATLSHALNH